MRKFRSRMRGGDGKAVGTGGSASVAQQNSQGDGLDAGKPGAVMPKKNDDDKQTGGQEGFGTMAGGRRRRRSQRRRSRRMSRRVARRTHRRRSQCRRGGMGNVRRTLAKAIVPFGLWGVQRLMRSKKNRKTMKRKRKGKRVSSLL